MAEICAKEHLRIYLEELRGHRDRAHLGGDPLPGHREGVDVVVAAGDDLHLADRRRDAADLVRRLDRGDEIDQVVAAPDDVLGVVVEVGGEVLHFGGVAVVDEQAGLVRLVACAALREEGDLRIIGRPDGIFVVADHDRLIVDGFAGIEVGGLADVLRRAAFEVVDEDVRIGRHGVGGARQRFAGVGQHRPGVVPGDLGHVEIGRQRGVPLRVGHDVPAARHDSLAQLADEDVAVFALVPVVPVAGHQVVVDAGFRFVHILVDVRRTAVGRPHGLHPPDVLSVGAYAEALHVGNALALAAARDLRRVAARGVHPPHLHRTAAVREEIDVPSVGAPLRREAVRREVRQACHSLRVHVLDPDRRHAAVLGHVVVGLLVEERPAVGRERRAARAAHLPHHLGGEASGGDLFGRQRIVDRKGLRPLVARAQPRSCNSHRQDDFFHLRKGFPIYCYFC